MLFQHLRSEPIDILELGLARTNQDFRGRSEIRSGVTSPSVRLWLDYFLKAKVTGFDLSDFSDQQDDRFDFVRGDLGSPDDLHKISGLGRMFDIVVDDGSHATYHQMLAFANLFPLVKEGGFFIIEDLIGQPKQIEEAHPPSHKMADLIREFLRLGYFPETAPVRSEELNCHIAAINNVLIVPYHNRAGNGDQLVVIHKRSCTHYHHYRAKIRFYGKAVTRKDSASLERHLEVDPSCPYPHAHLAELALQENRYEDALAGVNTALRLASEDIDLTVLHCRVLSGMDRSEDAAEEALKMMTTTPKAERVACELAPVLTKSGAVGPAKSVAHRWLELESDSSRAHYLIGQCLEAEESWAEAAQNYLAAFDRLPTHLMYLRAYSRAALCAEPENFGKERVVEYLLAQEERFHERSGYHVLLAQIFKDLGQIERARQRVSLAVRDSERKSWAKTFLESLPNKETKRRAKWPWRIPIGRSGN
jgi:tetratricopeptide (TPR) repeat protein